MQDVERTRVVAAVVVEGRSSGNLETAAFIHVAERCERESEPIVVVELAEQSTNGASWTIRLAVPPGSRNST